MLEIKNVTKVYTTGSFTQRALNDVSIKFRDNEFVSILGPSGSGKTTLLNIVGGLDHYDTGDLIINGISTKKYKDHDWDSYRNHQIGFVFQSYNLIEHQSVIANVELALALSGVSSKERRKRALEALRKVGLEEHINKRPNQLSGGQMQRVAIARALVNNPEILLADEPTGALDSDTSTQIMALLKEIAKDKLVIMVTHNPALAENYSTRIVKLQDGRVISDTNPLLDDQEVTSHAPSGKTKMSLTTALGLSLNNLMTKKGRTILTSFAGSIGIIGIALILSLSNGVQLYIKQVEEDTLASYPISIQETSLNIADIFTSMEEPEDVENPDPNTIYSIPSTNNLLKMTSQQSTQNNLEEFKKYLDANRAEIEPYVQAVQLEYPINLKIYNQADDGSYIQVAPNNLMDDIAIESSGGFPMAMGNSEVFYELIETPEGNPDPAFEQVVGKWPKSANEVILIVDNENRISDYTLYSLGLLDRQDLMDDYENILDNKEVQDRPIESYNFDDLLGTEFKIILNTDIFEKVSDAWIDRSEDTTYMENLLKQARTLEVVGIYREVGDSTDFTNNSGFIGYSSDLTQTIINEIKDQEIVQHQIDQPDTNVLTNLPFPTAQGEEFNLEDLSEEQQMQLMTMSPEEIADMMTLYRENSSMSYEANMATFGFVDEAKPSGISLYPKDFAAKDKIAQMIDDYNQDQRDKGFDENVITYSDLIKTMMNSVTSIINMISYVLIAFVAVSLVVSSIMIGIITYISVLERTKEIGILRAIGASKKDISRVFNAETLIIGLFSGLIGIGVTLLLIWPINQIIFNLTDVTNVAALPYQGAILLIVISVVLTLVAGLIPANKASKKDPVEALRSE